MLRAKTLAALTETTSKTVTQKNIVLDPEYFDRNQMKFEN